MQIKGTNLILKRVYSIATSSYDCTDLFHIGILLEKDEENQQLKIINEQYKTLMISFSRITLMKDITDEYPKEALDLLRKEYNFRKKLEKMQEEVKSLERRLEMEKDNIEWFIEWRKKEKEGEKSIREIKGQLSPKEFLEVLEKTLEGSKLEKEMGEKGYTISIDDEEPYMRLTSVYQLNVLNTELESLNNEKISTYLCELRKNHLKECKYLIPFSGELSKEIAEEIGKRMSK